MNQSKTTIPPDVNALLDKWISNSEKYSAAHKVEASTLKKRHSLLGTSSMILIAIVGTNIFTDIQQVATTPELKWLLAFLSMVASIFAALVTFYNFSERSASHQSASKEYDDIVCQLEILKTSVMAMKPIDWRNNLTAYSHHIEAIGRRVELPSSMVIHKKLAHKPRDFSLGSGKGTRIIVERIPREGYVEELKQVFIASCNR
ncbi:SLATT domain-containing protein [Thalassomonas sp. RHCl1]|uniref:SLATT domain-containing protein n=1 Tax=Thalassomonas sp. RHCl1 TaxID=2995320 RepID=UPI00248D3172|nr:SLATT domain-containing protein [Thalassomonas sp. RHCl1]